jgi:hypothetical protein
MILWLLSQNYATHPLVFQVLIDPITLNNDRPILSRANRTYEAGAKTFRHPPHQRRIVDTRKSADRNSQSRILEVNMKIKYKMTYLLYFCSPRGFIESMGLLQVLLGVPKSSGIRLVTPRDDKMTVK